MPSAPASSMQRLAVGRGSADSEEAFNACIDAIGFVLRTYGQTTFELDGDPVDETRSTFTGWEKHLLVGAPAPEGSGGEGGVRDWRGMQSYFRGYRNREVVYVNKSIEGMRGVIWSFVNRLSAAMAADTKDDELVKDHLVRIQSGIDTKNADELVNRAQEAVAVIGQVLEKRSERQKEQLTALASEVRSLGSRLEEAKREGQLDSLTKLYNRACFDQYLERTASYAFFGTPAALMMIDIDHFKKVNDTHGHPAGDAVIKAVSDSLIRAFPRKGDLVARYGGEEFAVILRDTKREDVRLLAERVLNLVRNISVRVGAHEIRPTVSIGYSTYRMNDQAADWLRRTDEALYEAKHSGRNCTRDGTDRA